MWEIKLENIGGIEEGEMAFEEGANVIKGSNFRGKSSLLRAIQVVTGADGQVQGDPLTEGVDSGKIELHTPTGDYKCNLSREDGGTNISGETVLTSAQERELTSQFAYLGENNEVRRAVREHQMDRLGQLLINPLDIDAINRDIVQEKKRQSEIKEELEKANQAADKLPKRQEEVTQLENQIEELEEKRDKLEAEVEESEEQAELRNDLNQRENKLEKKKKRVSTLKSGIERREEKLEEKKAELDELEIPDVPDADLSGKKERVEELDVKTNLLADLHRSNTQLLREGEEDLVSGIEHGLQGDSVECWVCGNEAPKDTIEQRVNEIRHKKEELEEEKDALEEEIDEHEQKKRTARSAKNKKENLQEDIREISEALEQKRQELEAAQQKVDELEEEANELEEKIDEGDNSSSELTDVDRKLGRKESKLQTKKEDLERLEQEASRVDSLTNELKEVKGRLETLRTRKEGMVKELEEEFGEQLDTIVSKFSPGFDGGHLNLDAERETCEIVIARSGAEAKLENLSEGEKELIGIAIAIAGYETFDVGEFAPCIFLDGIGQLAAEHIKLITEYIKSRTDLFIVTAYPESGDFNATTVTPDQWETVFGKGELEAH